MKRLDDPVVINEIVVSLIVLGVVILLVGGWQWTSRGLYKEKVNSSV